MASKTAFIASMFFLVAGSAAHAECEFDGGSPPEGEFLERNTRLSLGGDSCNVFVIEVESCDPLDLDSCVFITIPRAETFAWQQCRFSNVITQSKLEDYLYDSAFECGEGEFCVKIRGACGQLVGDTLLSSEFVEAESAIRTWKIRLEVDVD